MKTANILDPVHNTLAKLVWDEPQSPKPILMPPHKKWIIKEIHGALDRNGYDGMSRWLSLVFTGSLCTYQYSDRSDVDISLFVNSTHFPEWSRAELIGLMVEEMDGQTLPGTPYPLQCFVVAPEISKTDLYKPGLRAGYELETDKWIEPPDPDRAFDINTEMHDLYTHALEAADKMERLIKFEPHKAVMYWEQLHRKRRSDQIAGKGDFAESNIMYKSIVNRGLTEDLGRIMGKKIAL